MYGTFSEAVAREQRLDLLRKAAAARAASRGRPARRRGRGTRNEENHSVATVVRSLGHPFVAFQGWYAAGAL